MASIDFSEEQRDVLKQVQKLFNVANSTTHPAERELFEKKAQDLLLAYNLSASALGDADEGRRAQEKLKGGFYRYERTLWRYVADVNFCLHWQSQDWIDRPEEDRKRKKVQERYSYWAQRHRKVTRQHLVGRAINVEATKFMVSYLKDAIERELKAHLFGDTAQSERIEGSGEMLRSKRATDFREAAADALASRLWERREDQEAEEKRKRLAEEALRAAGGVGDGTGTALTISAVRQSERDANTDLIMGEGWSARDRAERAARAAAARAADEEFTRWAAAHPEEAKAAEEKRRKEERENSKKRGRKTKSSKERSISDWGAYEAGLAAGKRIGLDPQTTHAGKPRMIGNQ